MNARTWDRTLIYGSAILLALWVVVPFYLIFLSAFSRPDDVFVYPKPLLPTNFSTATMEFFLQSTGVFASVINSIAVAVVTIVLSLALGAPAGYALARFTFRGRALPAQLLSALQQSPLYFKFAGGFFMVMPAVVFIFFMRRYLLNLWGGR